MTVYDRRVQVEAGKRVRIRVNLAAVGGATIEESVVDYIQGSGKMLPGLERALMGLTAGAKKDGVLAAKDAFGDPLHSPHKEMKRAEFPADASLAVGARFTAKGANGTEVVLLVNKVTNEAIDVQLLHPLADADIAYKVEVLDVTDPMPPPLPPEALALDEA